MTDESTRYLNGNVFGSSKRETRATVTVEQPPGTSTLQTSVQHGPTGPRPMTSGGTRILILKTDKGNAVPLLLRQKPTINQMAGLEHVIGEWEDPETHEKVKLAWYSPHAPDYDEIDPAADAKAFGEYYACRTDNPNQRALPVLVSALDRRRCRRKLREDDRLRRVDRAWWLSTLAQIEQDKAKVVPVPGPTSMRADLDVRKRKFTPAVSIARTRISATPVTAIAPSVIASISAVATGADDSAADESFWDVSTVTGVLGGLQAGASAFIATPGPPQAKVVAGLAAAAGGAIAGWETGTVIEGVLDDFSAAASQFGDGLSEETLSLLANLEGALGS